MILVFRHAESPYQTIDVALRGLVAEQRYVLTFDSSGEQRQSRGDELMSSLLLSLGKKPASDLITYRAVVARNEK